MLRLAALYIIPMDKCRAQGKSSGSMGSSRGAHRPSRFAATESTLFASMDGLMSLIWHPDVGVLQGPPVLKMLQLLAQERCMKRWT